jgi:hypothetical protein
VGRGHKKTFNFSASAACGKIKITRGGALTTNGIRGYYNGPFQGGGFIAKHQIDFDFEPRFSPLLPISYLYTMKKAKSTIKDRFVLSLEKRFKKEMPRIWKEIELYEIRLKNGALNNAPDTSPQFKV